jgi:hypothetical protein
MRHTLPAALALVLLLPSAAHAAGDAAKPKKPIATIQPEPSVHVEGGDALTVAPIQGEGLPNLYPISAARAYQVLRDEARDARPNARLYSLSTDLYALSADGTSSGWIAEFLTDTPGELVTVMYSEGEIEAPYIGSVGPDRPGVPEPDAVGYDTKKLYQETMQYATGVVDPITRVTASLYRSAGSGKALWLLDVYGDDDRIGQTVVFEARTMKFSHKTK